MAETHSGYIKKQQHDIGMKGHISGLFWGHWAGRTVLELCMSWQINWRKHYIHALRLTIELKTTRVRTRIMVCWKDNREQISNRELRDTAGEKRRLNSDGKTALPMYSRKNWENWTTTERRFAPWRRPTPVRIPGELSWHANSRGIHTGVVAVLHHCRVLLLWVIPRYIIPKTFLLDRRQILPTLETLQNFVCVFFCLIQDFSIVFGGVASFSLKNCQAFSHQGAPTCLTQRRSEIVSQRTFVLIAPGQNIQQPYREKRPSDNRRRQCEPSDHHVTLTLSLSVLWLRLGLGLAWFCTGTRFWHGPRGLRWYRHSLRGVLG